MNSPHRLTDGQLAFLQSTDSPTIANAIEQFRVRPRHEGYLAGPIRAAFPDLGVMVGRALTVTMRSPVDRPADGNGFWKLWEALESAEGPVVVVIADESGSSDRVAYAGEIMVRMARRLGAVGMITDGGLRDLDEVRALGFHFFMPYPVVSHANFEIASVGVPVVVGGQPIQTGDLLHGDCNGVVVIPWQILPQLSDAVDTIRSRESSDIEYIESEEFTLEGYKAARNYGA